MHRGDSYFYIEAALSLIGLAWAVMGLFFMKMNKERKSSALIYALCLVLVMIQPLFRPLLFFFYPHPRILFSLFLETQSFPLLYGPLFFLYTKRIMNEKDSVGRFIHFIPFILIYSLEFVLAGRATPRSGISPIIFFHTIMTAVSVMTYGSLVLKRIYIYSKSINDHFSSRESDITLSWLRNLALGYMLLFGLSFLILFSFAMFQPGSGVRSPQIITIFPLVIFIFYFTFFASRQNVVRIDTSINSELKKTELKDEKSSTSREELLALSKLLKRYMDDSKVFLDSELTLEKLAANMNVSRHKLSQALNEEMKMNFYSFVNDLRVMEFEKMIRAGKHNNLSIIGLAFECGFKTSSSFYNVMKKVKGITPKQFIHELSSEKK